MSNDKRGRKVAIVGATGAVGEVLLSILEERNFPIKDLRPLASKSDGRSVRFKGKSLPVMETTETAFQDIDFAFFAATGSLSKKLAPVVAECGGVAIDKSSTWRLDASVPLVVPEINPNALDKHKGIVACPNCTTIGFVMALEPIRRRAGLQNVVVTTMQAVSGAGKPGLEELESQLESISRGEEPLNSTFAAPIAANVIPLCEGFRPDGFSTEEVKLLFETRKILDSHSLNVSMTCVRVPVPIGHSASILIETESPLSPEEARKAYEAFPGVRLLDDPENNVFPTPRDAAGTDDVIIGRIRRDLASPALWVWQVSDNLRKGAATNAVQIAEEMMARGLK
ncbi:aspartate-semialdehyde dehydrogenase [Myxococcota bacterium]|nr:aspartate-semialdehyde dehydrogenase [Myxococcota bacterium]